MNNGRIISISGLDAAGKTTQMDLLLQKLEANSRPFCVYSVRFGFTKGIDSLRWKYWKKSKKTEVDFSSSQPTSRSLRENDTVLYRLYLLLAMLDLAITLLKIRWNRWREKVVVCSRYVWDNHIYIGEYFPHIEAKNWWLWKLVKKCALEPDLSIFLSIPAQVSYERILNNRGVEQQDMKTLAQREELYKGVEEEAGWLVLSALRSKNELTKEIWERFQQIVP